MPQPATIAAALSVIDFMLAKAVGVDRVTQIARTETVDRRLLYNEWHRRTRKAAAEATRLILAGKPIGPVMKAFDSRLGGWPRAITKQHLAAVERAYRLARSAGWQKASGKTKRSLQYDSPMMELPERLEQPDPIDPEELPVKKQELPEVDFLFDVADEAAVAALQQKEVFWIGRHYNRGVRGSIKKAAQEAITTGRRRKWGADQLQQHLMNGGLAVEIPRLYTGTARTYFEGVVANAMTVGRVQGQLRSFLDLGITRYEIVNPVDERTCIVCQTMAGKVFLLDQGTKVMEDEIAATTPRGVKNAHPWVQPKQLDGGAVQFAPRTGTPPVTTKAGNVSPEDSAALAQAGFCIPPFHFRCRCTVDASFEAGSFNVDEVAPPPAPMKVAVPGRLPAVVKPKTTTPGIPRPQRPDKVAPVEFKMDDFESAVKVYATNPEQRAPQAELRKQLNSLLAKHGMIATDVANKSGGRAKVLIKELGNRIAGQYIRDNGEIRITRRTLDLVKMWLERPDSRLGMNGMQVLVHEALHGHSARWGKFGDKFKLFTMIEEATTENATLYILRKEFGFSGDFGIYARFRGQVEDAVEKAYRDIAKITFSGKKEGLTNMVDRASIGVKSGTEKKKIFTPKQRAKMFAEQFTLPPEKAGELGREKAEQLVEKLRKRIQSNLESKAAPL